MQETFSVMSVALDCMFEIFIIMTISVKPYDRNLKGNDKLNIFENLNLYDTLNSMKEAFLVCLI